MCGLSIDIVFVCIYVLFYFVNVFCFNINVLFVVCYCLLLMIGFSFTEVFNVVYSLYMILYDFMLIVL